MRTAGGGLIAGGQALRAREGKDRGVGWDRKQGRSSRREKRGEDRSESEMGQQGQKGHYVPLMARD